MNAHPRRLIVSPLFVAVRATSCSCFICWSICSLPSCGKRATSHELLAGAETLSAFLIAGDDTTLETVIFHSSNPAKPQAPDKNESLGYERLSTREYMRCSI